MADKKYKTTQKFLDDQANEREQERDEAQKKIDLLYAQLRERDKDKANCERVTSEVSRFWCGNLIYCISLLTMMLHVGVGQLKRISFVRAFLIAVTL